MTPPSAARRLPTVLEAALLDQKPGITAYEYAETAVLVDLRNVLKAFEAVALMTEDASAEALAIRGWERFTKKLDTESTAEFRQRIRDAANLYRPWQGTEKGIKQLLHHMGLLRPSWIYLTLGGSDCYMEIGSVTGLSVTCPDPAKLFLVGIVDETGDATGLYEWSGSSWDPVGTTGLYPEGRGATAAALASADFSLLPLPALGLFLACEVTAEEQLTLPRIYARLEYAE